MTRQPPRTLAGDLQALQEAVTALRDALWVALRRDAEMIAWTIVLGLMLGGLLAAWFGILPNP